MYMNDGAWYVVNEGDAVVITDQNLEHSVRVPIDVFDALVFMRWAQIVEGPPRLRGGELRRKAIAVCDLNPTLGSEPLRLWVGLTSLYEG